MSRSFCVFCLSVSLAGMIVLNFFVQARLISRTIFRCAPVPDQMSGVQELLPLKPYLGRARFVGYYTDTYGPGFWFDASRVHRLSRAQYVLSPSLLDLTRCFEHDLVLFDCRQERCFEGPLARYGYAAVYALNERTVLARRKDPE